MEDRKTEESVVLPIVAKARERFFYSLAGLSGGAFLLIFLFDLRYVSHTVHDYRNGRSEGSWPV
jgi:hypothetical protein